MNADMKQPGPESPEIGKVRRELSATVVRRDQVVLVREHWDQLPEHVGGGRKTLQEQQNRRIDRISQ